MANYISKTNIDSRRFVPPSSRYLESQILYYTENNLLTFETYKRKDIARSNKDKYAVISPGVEYRPDLVSNQAYGTVDFWWKILEANGMKDIWEFKAGTNIRIPDAFF